MLKQAVSDAVTLPEGAPSDLCYQAYLEGWPFQVSVYPSALSRKLQFPHPSTGRIISPFFVEKMR